MATTYLDLSNEIFKSLNEVPFSSQSDFTSATGFHQFIKETINDVIAEIYTREDSEWPFQKSNKKQVLTIGNQGPYSVPADCRKVDWDSFYIDFVYGDQDDFTSVTCTTTTFTIAGGSFTDKGFAVGMKVKWAGLSENTDDVVTITAITATTMQVSETLTAIPVAETAFTVTNAYESPDADKLTYMDIDAYRNQYLANSITIRDTGDYDKPYFVVQNTDNTITFGPYKPDQTYLVSYDYFSKFTPLSAYNDESDIPDDYKHVIKKGVLKHAHMFRDNFEAVSYYTEEYEKAINEMRRELIPQPHFMRFET